MRYAVPGYVPVYRAITGYLQLLASPVRAAARKVSHQS